MQNFLKQYELVQFGQKITFDGSNSNGILCQSDTTKISPSDIAVLFPHQQQQKFETFSNT
jgi:hypothetical protein